MTDLDETALKAEIDHISEKIDRIMKKVDRLYPSQPPPDQIGQYPGNLKLAFCHSFRHWLEFRVKVCGAVTGQLHHAFVTVRKGAMLREFC